MQALSRCQSVVVVEIVSVLISDASIVTKQNKLLPVFSYHMNSQSLFSHLTP